jgi:hypothetical protein
VPLLPLLRRFLQFEALAAVGPQRLEKAVAGEVGARDHRHQGPVHELGNEGRDLGPGHAFSRTHLLGRLEREAAGEHRQSVEQPAWGRAQALV